MTESRRKPDGSPPQRRRPPQKRPQRRKIDVVCEGCGTRFQAVVRRESYEAPCLCCEQPVLVTGMTDAVPSQGIGTVVANPAERHGGNVFHAAKKAPRRRARGASGPLLPFLSAFAFPWYPEVVWRWVILSAGCSIVTFLFVVVNWCWSLGGLMAEGGYALTLALGWLAIITFSYLAASSTSIITETAAGAERVSDWPEPDWREWCAEAAGFVPAVAAAIAVAYGVGRLSEATLGYLWIAFVATFFVVTPIFVLSVFEANSSMMIVSPFIAWSLLRRWWAWLRFYAMSGILAILWPGTLVYGYRLQPFYVTLVTGPLMAAALLIYARLLGRVAQACGQP